MKQYIEKYDIIVHIKFIKIKGVSMHKDVIVEEMKIFFSLLGNTTRLKIVLALLKKPCNVSQLQEEVNMSQTAVSHQLAALKKANLVQYQQMGKERIYSLADEHVNIILMSTKGHIEHTLYDKKCDGCYLKKRCLNE